MRHRSTRRLVRPATATGAAVLCALAACSWPAPAGAGGVAGIAAGALPAAPVSNPLPSPAPVPKSLPSTAPMPVPSTVPLPEAAHATEPLTHATEAVPAPGTVTHAAETLTVPETVTHVTEALHAPETPRVEAPRVTEPPHVGELPKVTVNPGGPGPGGSPGSGGSSGSLAPTAAKTIPAASATGSKGATGGRAPARPGHISAGARRKHGARGGGNSAGGAAGGTGATTSTPPGAAAATGATRLAASRQRVSHGDGGPLATLGRELPLPLPVPDWSKPIIALLLLLALGLAVRARLVTRRARSLEARERRLLRDMGAMQAALVPEVPASIGGLDVSVAYRPAEGPAAGGDFYDVFPLDEHRTAVMLGDVTGHGHEALQRAAMARFTLRAHLHEQRMPRIALARTSQALVDPDLAQLATVAVAVYDRRRGTLTYALAGHPPPLLLGMAAAEPPLACSSPPLGWEMPTGRRQRTISLTRGVRACFFSDGLVDARRPTLRSDRHPALLGTARLRELLAALPDEEGAEQLLEAVRAEATATPDDMAACILAARDDSPTRVDLEELEVSAETLEGGKLDAYLRGCGLPGARRDELIAKVRAQLALSETALVLVDRTAKAPRVRITAPAAGEPALHHVQPALA